MPFDVPPQKPDFNLDADATIGLLIDGKPLIIPKKPTRPCIVIDAGHGGKDPGSISIRGRKEKHVALKAALVFAEELRKSGRYVVKLTRTRDVFVPVRQRFKVARQANADFFISIHADSHPSKQVRGLSIYTLSRKASDHEAQRLSQQENKAAYYENIALDDESLDGDLVDVITDIARSGSSRTALMLAKALHDDLTKAKLAKVMKLRSAGLKVLKAPEVPSILVELGFLSNQHDEVLVHSAKYHKNLAKSLIRALDRYYDKT